MLRQCNKFICRLAGRRFPMQTFFAALFVFSILIGIGNCYAQGSGSLQIRDTISQNDSKLSRSEFLFRENQRKHQEWLAQIPDYEMKLYDRVKKINKRTVRLTRSIIFGLVIVLIFVSGVLYLILTRAAKEACLSIHGSLDPGNKNAVRARRRFDLERYFKKIRKDQDVVDELLFRIRCDFENNENCFSSPHFVAEINNELDTNFMDKKLGAG